MSQSDPTLLPKSVSIHQAFGYEKIPTIWSFDITPFFETHLQVAAVLLKEESLNVVQQLFAQVRKKCHPSNVCDDYVIFRSTCETARWISHSAKCQH